MNLYTIKKVRQVFGSREVLCIADLAIESGLIYGLLGPNGSGKTTLMKILAFLDQPSEGDITFKDQAVTPQNMTGFRASVVWAPQFPVMFTGSLRYNVEYPLKLRGLPGQARRKRALELLDLVGLAALADAPARRLSGGEAQRASLARAIAAGAEVLLLDEPTANVDAQARQDLVALIKELWQSHNLSIILTTHDASLDAQLCHRQIRLKDGHLQSLSDAAVYDAVLSKDGERFILQVPAEIQARAGELILTGIAEQNMNVRLSLVSRGGRGLELVLNDDKTNPLYKSLTLGTTLWLKNVR